jgi:phosphonate transport system substrate-binding protein
MAAFCRQGVGVLLLRAPNQEDEPNMSFPLSKFGRAILFVAGLLAAGRSVYADTYSFGVLTLRNVTITAQYWNPILEYVGRKSGVKLEFATRKTSQEISAPQVRGEFDFLYSNHILTPIHAAAGYRVFARPAGEPIFGQIIVAENSSLRSLRDLEGLGMGFPSKFAFVAYAVPMVELYRQGVTVKPVMAGNMEGVIAQVRAGEIPVGAVNSKVLKAYAAREGFRYRALWTSEPYLDFPIAVQPRVPEAVVKAVRDALVGMSKDPEGRKILETSAAVIKLEPPYGFLPAQDSDYDSQREVYRTIWKIEGR